MILTLFKVKRMTKLGAKSLFEHKLRSFLTALGIIFGVGSVIAMLAIGEGASFEAREQIRSMGSRNVILKSRKPPEANTKSGTNQNLSVYGLTDNDALRIKTLFPAAQVQIPSRIISERIRRGAQRPPGRIVGTVPWFLEGGGLEISRGRFINEDDVRSVANVVVLDEATAQLRVPRSPPIGQNIFLGSQPFHVVGTVRPIRKPENGDGAKTETHGAYIPISAARKRFGEILTTRSTGSFAMEKVELHELTVTAPDDDSVVPLASNIRAMLQEFHKQEDFEIVIPLELLKQAEATKRIFNIVLGSIAAISLLVGGIGIMNIMLASVTERTREIGIRRALGATRTDIVLQFLAEALLLSLAGGMIGLAIGIGIPKIVTRFAGLATIVQPESLLLAFGISLCIGVVFGIYPAMRAAALSPIEALRHE
ncbi:MAG: ABC transporter permease [Lentisphaeria bacterium]|jgi:putative ABC transport system permease protein|nr:ABC transporter permease [Lentisphaeria bacterium]